MSFTDPSQSPAPAEPPEQREAVPDAAHPTLSWFLRRELISLPIALVIVATLLIFGISPATLLFAALLTVLVLGWIWSR